MSTGRAWKDSVFQVASNILVFPSTGARPLPASAPNENKNDAESESVKDSVVEEESPNKRQRIDKALPAQQQGSTTN